MNTDAADTCNEMTPARIEPCAKSQIAYESDVLSIRPTWQAYINVSVSSRGCVVVLLGAW